MGRSRVTARDGGGDVVATGSVTLGVSTGNLATALQGIATLDWDGDKKLDIAVLVRADRKAVRGFPTVVAPARLC